MVLEDETSKPMIDGPQNPMDPEHFLSVYDFKRTLIFIYISIYKYNKHRATLNKFLSF